MGRKRVKKLEAGGKTTLYIPQDIDINVLEFLQTQKNLSKALIDLAYMHVYSLAPNSPWLIFNKPQVKRKRIKKLEAGGKTTLYIPQDIDMNVLEFLQTQKNLSKALIELAYIYVYQISVSDSLPKSPALSSPRMGSLESTMLINKYQDTERKNEEISKRSKKYEALKSMLDTDKLG